MKTEYIVSLNKVRKEYPGVVALDDISIDFRRGEVHAIAGENGAGKSTLIKILTGAIRPDSGEIVVDGQSFRGLRPQQALYGLGIVAIYQEFNLIPYRSIMENIFLGKELKRNGLLDIKAMRLESSRLLKLLGITIDPGTIVRNIGVAYQQIVEIAKAISNDVNILIMDEPTAPLTTLEVNILKDLIKKLRDSGITIIYISHRMSENFELADRITVLRDGAFVSTVDADTTSRSDLISMMVGRDVGISYPQHKVAVTREPLLEVKGLYSQKYIKDISFTLHQGEILGFGGLVGAGRTELAMALFGAAPIEQGEVFLSGRNINIRSTADAIKNGIALVPEDRKRHGILGHLSVRDNVSFSSMSNISRFSLVNRKKQIGIAEGFRKALSIKTPSVEKESRQLSGGNQQKVVLAKWLATNSNILIFDEPTRGIDIGAKQEIHQLIVELADNGKGIILISSEMPELLGMSDRILVMRDGSIVGYFSREEVTPEAVLELAAHE